MSTPLLALHGVGKTYGGGGWWPPGRKQTASVAVADADLVVEPGATVGLVGESGSGKTTLARIAAGLLAASSGSVHWRGQPVHGLRGEDWLDYRRGVQYVFQNPMTALNPRRRLGATLDDTLRGLTELKAEARAARIDEIAGQTGIDRSLLERFPHQLSGGQAQRVAIARALLGSPQLVILDEPVSALDVSLQAQILELLARLRERHGLAYLFISHDLAVVERLCDCICVMRAGRIVDHGPRQRVLKDPTNDYTRRLLAAVPGLGAASAAG
jgi:peptide/nickel transport system ATP-binding protein